jgi:hypothetical protein
VLFGGDHDDGDVNTGKSAAGLLHSASHWLLITTEAMQSIGVIVEY